MEKCQHNADAGEKRPASILNIVSSTFRRHLPLVGCTSYLAFSAHITNPKLFRSLFMPNESVITNALWLTAHVGTGSFIYSSRHLQRTTPLWRAVYSITGAVLFNFGSVLVWATVGLCLPRGGVLCTLFGVVSGIAFLDIARRYVKLVDCSIPA